MTVEPPLIVTALLAAWAVNVEAITPAEPERVKAPAVDVLACERPPVKVMAAAIVLLAVTAAVAGDVKFTAPAIVLVAFTAVAPQVDSIYSACNTYTCITDEINDFHVSYGYINKWVNGGSNRGDAKRVARACTAVDIIDK